MSETLSQPATLPDPLALVQQLDRDAIRARLDALDRERSALLVLLRAAQRMQRDVRTDQPEEGRP